jgi:hypothetical protein
MNMKLNVTRGPIRATSFLRLALAAVAVSGLLSAAEAQTQEQPQSQSQTASVTINGTAVNFTGQAPMEQNGHMLVPLRGVLEQLGAYVDFNSSTQTVTAVRGNTTIVLPVGQTTATVNGSSVTLDVPAEIVSGSTLVPLRFLAETLGASVDYNSGTYVVAIVTSGGSPGTEHYGHAASAEHRMEWRDRHGLDAASGESTVRAQIEAIYSNSDPVRIALRISQDSGTATMAGGSEVTLPMHANATLTREHENGPMETIGVDRLHVGDHVAVLCSPDGHIRAVDVIHHDDATH